MHLRCARTAAILVALCLAVAHGQSPVGSGFTYQGQLKQNGQPFNGPANLIFRLFDAATGGSLLGTQTLNGVNVSGGLLIVPLNAGGEFGANAFNGDSRWLEVTANGTLLTPRQVLTATPYAAFSLAPWSRNGSALAYVAGNVGIGTSSPAALLHVNGNIGVGVANIPAGLTSELGGTNTPILNLDVNFRHPNLHTAFIGGAFRIDARNDVADPLFQFISRPAGSNTETIIAALTRAGNFGVGTTTPAARVEIDSASGQDALRLNGFSEPDMLFTQTGHSRQGIVIWADHFMIANDVASGAAAVLRDDGSWSSASDRRMKTDIAPAAGLLEKALALRPAEFSLKNPERTRDSQRYLGLIAQEVQPVLPELVSGTDMLRLNYDRLAVVAIGAIQEQQALIASQETTIAAQRERIKKLEDQTAASQTALESLRSAANAKDARINDLAARLQKLEASVNALAQAQPTPAVGAALAGRARRE